MKKYVCRFCQFKHQYKFWKRGKYIVYNCVPFGGIAFNNVAYPPLYFAKIHIRRTISRQNSGIPKRKNTYLCELPQEHGRPGGPSQVWEDIVQAQGGPRVCQQDCCRQSLHQWYELKHIPKNVCGFHPQTDSLHDEKWDFSYWSYPLQAALCWTDVIDAEVFIAVNVPGWPRNPSRNQFGRKWGRARRNMRRRFRQKFPWYE